MQLTTRPAPFAAPDVFMIRHTALSARGPVSNALAGGLRRTTGNYFSPPGAAVRRFASVRRFDRHFFQAKSEIVLMLIVLNTHSAAHNRLAGVFTDGRSSRLIFKRRSAMLVAMPLHYGRRIACAAYCSEKKEVP
jgi:hypothetical protein